MSEAAEPPPALPPAASPSYPEAPEKTNSGGPGAVIALLGGILVVLGSMMPWLTAVDPYSGIISKGGMDAAGDGNVTILLGIVIIAIAGARFATRMHPAAQLLPILPALFTLMIASADYMQITAWIYDHRTYAGYAYTGSGLNMVFIGAIAAGIGSLIVRLRPREPSRTVPVRQVPPPPLAPVSEHPVPEPAPAAETVLESEPAKKVRDGWSDPSLKRVLAVLAVVATVAVVVGIAAASSGDNSPQSFKPEAASAGPSHPPGQGKWPAAVEVGWLRNCQTNGVTASYCNCLLAGLEARLTLEQVTADDAALRAGRPMPEAENQIVRSCGGTPKSK